MTTKRFERLLLCIVATIVLGIISCFALKSFSFFYSSNIIEQLFIIIAIMSAIFVAIMPCFNIVSKYYYEVIVKLVAWIELPLISAKIFSDLFIPNNSVWYTPIFIIIAILTFDIGYLLIVLSRD